MKQIPEKIDLDQVSEACDRIMKHLRSHREPDGDPESRAAQELKADLDAMATLCKFIYQIKDHIEWLENMISVFKKNGS